MKSIVSPFLIVLGLLSTHWTEKDSATHVRVFADFEAEKIIIEQGERVKFLDKSIGNPSHWNWRFESGLPKQTNESDPEVYYPKAGQYDVMITVSDGESTDTKIIKDYVKVKGLLHSFSFNGLLRDDINLDRSLDLNGKIQLVRDRNGFTSKAIYLQEDQKLSFKDEGEFLTNELTLSLWVKTKKSLDKNMVLVEKYGGREADYGFRVLLTDGHASFEGRDGSGALRSTGLSIHSIDDNEWHHVAAIITSNSTWQLWIDGMLEAEQINSHTIPEHYNKANLSVGHSNTFDFDHYEGAMDDLKIFNKALNMEAIVNLASH